MPSDWTWDGAEIPNHKPAFNSLVPAMSGETWVVREGASERLTDCVEDPLVEADYRAALNRPCWRSNWIIDVFADDGRYLGAVTPPEDILPHTMSLFVRDDLVVGVTQDSLGTTRVKRYRLVLPGER